jgi:undecaprenyl-diphosphatase
LLFLREVFRNAFYLHFHHDEETMLIQAIFLGVIEGLTEFLPISSTGHLILLIDLLKLATPSGKVLEITIQLGAILAICWLYRQKLTTILWQLPTERGAQQFVLHLLLAFLPAAIVGIAAHHAIKEHLFTPIVVAVMLILGGIAILLIERFRPAVRMHTLDELNSKTALKIGLFQCLAMIPGTSRSGATIMGSLLLGLDRKAATEFSFFLAIPTMFAATLYDLYKNYEALSTDSWAAIGVGFCAAFVTALCVVKFFVAFISRHGFALFAYYRIALGMIILLIAA